MCDCNTKKEVRTIIKINIKANQYLGEDEYEGADLMLPSGKGEMIDALDRAKVTYGSGEYTATPIYTTPPYLLKPLKSVESPSLAELSYLAHRMERMDQYDRQKLAGVITQHPCHSMADLINATHNLDKYSFYPGFTTDRQLGEHAIDNEIFPEFASMSDEALECLDRRVVGARMRQEEGGLLTREGYLVPEDAGWDDVYDPSLVERPITYHERDTVINLLLTGSENERNGIWLHCPATQEDIDYTLESIRADSFDDCIIQRVDSIIPALEYAISFDCDIEEVNRLAADIKTHCMDDLLKYKAAYELEDVTNLKHASDLTGRLEQYTLLPIPTAAEYGRRMLDESDMDVALAEEYGFDFDAYGRRRMEENDIRFTAYGALVTAVCQEMNLEQENTMEQTMGGM